MFCLWGISIMSDFDFRFGGIARLYGTAALTRFRAAHVMVVGIGGVGSWVVEALARSGVGRLSLVDLDDVCVSNINRQLHALDSTVGQSKVQVMAERVRVISPETRVEPREEFFTAETGPRLLGLAEGWIRGAPRLCGGCDRCHGQQGPTHRLVSWGGDSFGGVWRGRRAA